MAKKKAHAERSANRDVVLSARNDRQKEILRAIKESDVVIVAGPPGSGKTHIPVVYGIQQLLRGNIKRIIFTRPCVEAYGEKLGFQPGDFNAKIYPYMMPIFQILSEVLDARQLQMLIEAQAIQTIPLAFQRGITFKDCMVVADEFQNTIPEQVHMFLTRMGENCKMVITGDPVQADIKGVNGLVDALRRFEDVEQVRIVRTTQEDIVRHPLVALFDQKYTEDPPMNMEGNRGKNG